MPDPGTLWPSVFPNEGLGSLEKLTEAVTIPGAIRVLSVIRAIVLSGIVARGGAGS